jgi:hypothetical protein
MTQTQVDTLQEPNRALKDSTMDEYILQEIQLFVPKFNQNSSMNHELVRAEYEYPISSK